MKKVITVLLFVFLTGNVFLLTAQPPTQYLYNQARQKIAYIDAQNSLYLTSNRQQIAYLIASDNLEVLDVYSMEGQKLGHFRIGILYNTHKQIVAHLPGAIDRIERANAADKGIQSVLMDLQFYGWISLEKFLKGVEK
ncbi:hypothetical protein BKI52_38030 [marine bacterium AO1-C]|nr:hypothetical protein BKI52_38030 [marine bacterium AO1-C]